MTSQQRKDFLGYQQGELDAVLMYKSFAELTDNEELRAAFLEAAKDEGRHAAILSNFTKRKLQPKDTLAKYTSKVFKLVPKKLLLRGIALGEKSGGDGYKPYADIPEIKEIMSDEYRHCEKFIALSKSL